MMTLITECGRSSRNLSINFRRGTGTHGIIFALAGRGPDSGVTSYYPANKCLRFVLGKVIGDVLCDGSVNIPLLPTRLWLRS